MLLLYKKITDADTILMQAFGVVWTWPVICELFYYKSDPDTGVSYEFCKKFKNTSFSFTEHFRATASRIATGHCNKWLLVIHENHH